MVTLYLHFHGTRFYAGHWPTELDAAFEALRYFGQGLTHAVAGSVLVTLKN